jgi:anthranilate phosphoribosyltransferase
VDVKLTDLIGAVVDGKDLSAKEAEGAIDLFMSGEASEVEMAGLLVGLRAKGVTAVEVAGGVRALRKAMVPVHSSDPAVLVDTAGTGGGGVTTFNISTAAAIVAAGAGAQIAKHGNRSFTSRSGSADVLEALGVKIDLSATRMGEVLGEAGIVFMSLIVVITNWYVVRMKWNGLPNSRTLSRTIDSYYIGNLSCEPMPLQKHLTTTKYCYDSESLVVD